MVRGLWASTTRGPAGVQAGEGLRPGRTPGSTGRRRRSGSRPAPPRVERHRLVAQDADAVRRQGVGDGAVQVPVAAEAQGVADREVVVAQHGEDAVRRLQPAQHAGATRSTCW